MNCRLKRLSPRWNLIRCIYFNLSTISCIIFPLALPFKYHSPQPQLHYTQNNQISTSLSPLLSLSRNPYPKTSQNHQKNGAKYTNHSQKNLENSSSGIFHAEKRHFKGQIISRSQHDDEARQTRQQSRHTQSYVPPPPPRRRRHIRPPLPRPRRLLPRFTQRIRVQLQGQPELPPPFPPQQAQELPRATADRQQRDGGGPGADQQRGGVACAAGVRAEPHGEAAADN